MRSRCRCSMCPAIHINSRSWLRSSSTHEPSDPPLRVVLSFLFLSNQQETKRSQRQLVKTLTAGATASPGKADGQSPDSCKERVRGGSLNLTRRQKIHRPSRSSPCKFLPAKPSSLHRVRYPNRKYSTNVSKGAGHPRQTTPPGPAHGVCPDQTSTDKIVQCLRIVR